MLFADLSLVCRIERAEGRLITDCAAGIRARDPQRGVFVAHVGEGVAAHVGMEAPFNKMIGIGLGGPLGQADLAALATVETEFATRRTPLQAELSSLADGSVARLLSERGYTLVGFENVLGLRLDEAVASRLAGAQAPQGLEISAPGETDGNAWLDTVVTGFAHPDAVPGGESHESYPREAIEQAMTDMAQAPGCLRYLARFHDEGAIAGGGAMRVCEGVAQLCGSATLPALRRRGVQTALLARRLLDARSSGCDIAVITTQPGSKSQHNAQRHGFTLLYCRAILVRTPR
jgi:hypothetical protein